LRPNGSTEHKIEEENLKHYPGPKRNDLKESDLGDSKSIMRMRVVLSRTPPYVNNHS
jgi:hypothetical protein